MIRTPARRTAGAERSGEAIRMRAVLPSSLQKTRSSSIHTGHRQQASPRPDACDRAQQRPIVSGSSDNVRRDRDVFGDDHTSALSTTVNERFTVSRALPRSTSDQRRPSTSPRRIPVATSSRYAGMSRSSATDARNARVPRQRSRCADFGSDRHRRLDEGSDVARHQTKACRASASDRRNAMWRLRTVFGDEPTTVTVAFLEQARVQLLDVERTQRLQRSRARAGH